MRQFSNFLTFYFRILDFNYVKKECRRLGGKYGQVIQTSLTDRSYKKQRMLLRNYLMRRRSKQREQMLHQKMFYFKA